MTTPSFPAAVGMWLLMTALMMTPIVLPWLLALDRLGPGRRVWLFAAGYGAAWALFSVAAAVLQVGLAQVGWTAPLGTSAPLAAAVALISIGGYQFTRLKDHCLSHCRSPAGYLLNRWREGAVGHLTLGFGHGLFCLGCCWALMLLALVVGTMDLGWMGVLTAIMVVETTVPLGARMSRPLGALLVAGGLATLLP